MRNLFTLILIVLVVDSASKTIMQVTAINGDGDDKFITANSDRDGD